MITSVTLQAVPAFRLHAVETAMPLDEVLADLDELVADNEHFEFYWFPHTEIAATKRNNRTEADRPDPRARRRMGGRRPARQRRVRARLPARRGACPRSCRGSTG